MQFLLPIFLFFMTLSTSLFSTDPLAQRLAIPHESYTLPNGLHVILAVDKSTPFVATNIWYHVGAINEQRKKTGLAHLFEHLMFEGSEHTDSPFAEFEKRGATDTNASTNMERTNYYETVPKNQLETILSIESSRMFFLKITQEKLDEQRAVVRREREQRYETKPYATANLELWQNLFPKEHPFHGHVIGSHADLKAAALADVQSFYDKYYGPSNACLTIVGDFDVDTAKRLVNKYFATLPASPKQPVPTLPQIVLQEQTITKVDEKLGRLPLVRMHYLTPPWLKKGDAELDVLAHILTGGENGRLTKAMTRDNKLATNVSAYQQSFEQLSVFTIDVILNPGVDDATAIKQIDEVLAGLISIPPTQQEIERAKTPILSNFFFGLQNLGSRAELLQSYYRYAHDSNFIKQDLARYQSITQSDLVSTAQKYLPPGTARKILVATPAVTTFAKGN